VVCTILNRDLSPRPTASDVFPNELGRIRTAPGKCSIEGQTHAWLSAIAPPHRQSFDNKPSAPTGQFAETPRFRQAGAQLSSGPESEPPKPFRFKLSGSSASMAVTKPVAENFGR